MTLDHTFFIPSDMENVKNTKEFIRKYIDFKRLINTPFIEKGNNGMTHRFFLRRDITNEDLDVFVKTLVVRRLCKHLKILENETIHFTEFCKLLNKSVLDNHIVDMRHDVQFKNYFIKLKIMSHNVQFNKILNYNIL